VITPVPAIDERVSIIIVNYNGAEWLERCLESVFAQQYRPIEVIVVDNASIDGSVEMVKRNFPDVHLRVNDTNHGFAAANNEGVGLASADLVVLLNNDTVVDRLWLVELRKMLDHSGAAAVTSKVVTRGIPEEWYEMNGTLNYLGYNIMRVFRDLQQIFFAGGASLLFRRETVGVPFLDEYFLYHEDVYLSWRLRLQGRTVAMAQESIVEHRGSATTNKQPAALMTFYQERNRVLNCLLLYEAGTLVRLVPYFVADAVTKVMLSVVGRGKALGGILRAYAWIFSHREWIRTRRARIQMERTVADRSILQLMSCKVIDSEAILARTMNGLSRMYADIVGLHYHA
jgi:GT2 family glycosyltransferase